MRIVRAMIGAAVLICLSQASDLLAQDDLDFDALLSEIAEISATDQDAPESAAPAAETAPPADAADAEPPAPPDAEVESTEGMGIDEFLADVDEQDPAPEPVEPSEPAEPPVASETPSPAEVELEELMGLDEEPAAAPAVPEGDDSLLEDLMAAEDAVPEAQVAEDSFEDFLEDEMAPAADEGDVMEAAPTEMTEDDDFEALLIDTEVGDAQPAEAEMALEAEEAAPPMDIGEAEVAGAEEGMAEEGVDEEQLKDAAKVLSQQEEVRLRAQEVEALKDMEAGFKALSEMKYADAARFFEQSLLMPERPKTEQDRERARMGYAEANYRLARQKYDEKDAEAALEYVNKALNQAPDLQAAKRLQTKLEKIVARPKPPVPVRKRPEVVEVEKTVADLMAEGKQWYDAGRYTRAENIFGEILLEDPYNVSAMRFLKRIEDRKYNLSSRELEATRAKRMQEVRNAWNPPSWVVGAMDDRLGPVDPDGTSMLDGAAELEQKMENIVIPSLEFRQANITDVVNFLVDASIAGDPKGDGVNVILNLNIPGAEGGNGGASSGPAQDDFFPEAEPFDEFFEEPAAAAPTSGGGGFSSVPTITLNLRRVSLLDAIRYITEVAGLKYRIEHNAVIITPAEVVTGQVITRMYRVQPSILDTVMDSGDAGGGGGGGFGDEFGGGGGFGEQPGVKRRDLKGFFIDAGVPFPVGTSITFNPAISKLIVSNTPENQDKIARVLDEINVAPNQVEIEARFVEVNQTDMEELGLEWLLNDNWELATKQTGAPLGGRERLQFDENADAGGLTRGLRFFTLDSSAGSILPLPTFLGSEATQPLGNIWGFSSVLTNPEISVVLHALSQSGNSDLLSAPRVLARSGQTATIQVVKEIIYPTEFEQDVTTIRAQVGDTGATRDQQVVTVTPGSFETRPVGVILNVTPQVAPDGYTIDLALAPEVAALVEWINYGSVLENGSVVNIPQPVFESRNVSTTISIWDGATVVMGGLMLEELTTIDDKIPILGDIPFLGRLFRTEGERSIKVNLLIFVTARLVRPDGRPMNADTVSTVPQDAIMAGEGNPIP